MNQRRDPIFSSDRTQPVYPVDQSDTEIAAYYASATVGDKAALRTGTDPRRYIFKIVTIEKIKPEIGRLYVSPGDALSGSAFFRKSGRCCSPHGSARLVVPNALIEAWVRSNLLKRGE